jgi:hypothetical protein
MEKRQNEADEEQPMNWKSGNLHSMSVRNVIQTTIDEFGRSFGGSKNSGSWYFTGPDAIAVLSLQKSQYSPSYYLNVGLWLLGVGAATNPSQLTVTFRAVLRRWSRRISAGIWSYCSTLITQ